MGVGLGTYKYKAFISYSHQDKSWANWLHKRLETYPIPKHVVGMETSKGLAPRRLTPIFRDREELEAAGSLSDKIQQALISSENMVVLCSPRSAKSHWVNQEILQYKRLHPDGDIFSVIIAGEPFASNMPALEAEECFPPALRYEIDGDGELTDIPVEPLAADLRRQGDGKRLGSLKLVAGMIGVGLDEIIQRDMQRGRKRVMAITTLSIAGMLIMATLTGFALSARKEADARRNDAEGLIEFMITDLREKLEPVGRLDVLESVGQEAVAYYDKQDIRKMSDDALGRRARVFNYLGEIDKKLGNFDKAAERFQRAYETTAALLASDSRNADRIFDHAQSAFWVGWTHRMKDGNYELTEKYYREYDRLAQQLIEINPENRKWQIEVAYAHSNLADVYLIRSDTENGVIEYEESVKMFETIVSETPDDISMQVELAIEYGQLSKSQSHIMPLSLALETKNREMAIYERILAIKPNDQRARYLRVSERYRLIELLMLTGQFAEAEKMGRERLAELQKIAERDKINLGPQVALAWAYSLSAEFYLMIDKPELAEQHYQHAVASHNAVDRERTGFNSKLHDTDIPNELIGITIDYRLGKYDRAHKRIAKILAYPPDQVELKTHSVTENYVHALLLAGKISAAKNDMHSAKEYWKKMFDFDRSKNSLSIPTNRLLYYEASLLLGLEKEAKLELKHLEKIGVAKTILEAKRQ